ncbi:unnamed protein product [Auanema sp. JU1783]|nr:unnamed protein product [Auanema sp. JU1783]
MARGDKSPISDSSEDDYLEEESLSKKRKKSPLKKKVPAKRERKEVPQKAEEIAKSIQNENGSDAELDDEFRFAINDDDLLNMEIPPKPEPCMRADGTGARLMIREIIATNFKSYYGSQRIGPFHKNFSAIIGPNGSGKSNVIDSLLFVFGFRANKIRLKKLGDLIHNSSGKERPRFCTVEVIFQKIIDTSDGEFEIVDGSVFSVARTAYNDNTSKYTIDGKTRSIKDVVNKLREVGIDLVHNRFLILQGEVEQIAMMQPKAANPNQEGMLEYLEDIIGSSRFKVPIDKLAVKLDQLSGLRSHQTQKVKQADKEVQSLQQPVSEMLTFLRTENNISLLKNKLCYLKMHKFQREVEKRDVLLAELKTEKAEIEGKLEKLGEARKTSELEVQAVEQEKSVLMKNLEKIQAILTELEAKETRRTIDLTRVNKDINNLKKSSDKERAALKELEEIPEKAADEIEALEKKIEKFEKIVAENEERADDNRPLFEQKSAPAREKKQKIEEEFGIKQTAVDEISSKAAIAKQEYELSTAEAEKIKKRIGDINAQLESNTKAFEEKNQDLKEIQTQLPQKEKELSEERKRVPVLKAELDKLNSEVHSLRSKVSEESNFLNSKGEGNRTIKYLKSCQEKGELEGYYGRLGDLGAIDPMYDAAISTTVPQLNSHIVETKDGAMKSINLLIKGGIGRTNFMIVNQVANQVSDSHMNRPANHFPAPRMFDLIKIPQEKMKKVFYSAIRDTLVVKDLAEAKKIAQEQASKGNRNKYRFVTLNGSVMEHTGAITGGGKPKKGMMGTQVKNIDDEKNIREKLTSMSKDIEEKNERIQKLNDESRQVDQNIFHCTSAINKLTERNRTLKNEVPILKDKISNLEKQLEFQKKQASTHTIDEELVQEKREAVDKLIAEKEKAIEEQKEVKEELSKISEKLELLWKELCGDYQQKAEDAKKKLHNAEQEIAKTKSKLNSVEFDKKKVEKKLSSLLADLEKKTSWKEELVGTEEEYKEQISTQKEEKEKAETLTKEMDSKIKELRSSYSHMNEEESAIQKDLIDCKEKLGTVEAEHYAFQDEIKKLKREIGGLKLHDMKQYDVPKKVRTMTKDHFLDQSLEMEGEELIRQKEAEGESAEDEEAESNEDEDDNEAEAPQDVDCLPELTPEDLADESKDRLLFRIDKLQKRITATRKNINMNILKEFSAKLQAYETEMDSLDGIKKNYNSHGNLLESLKKQRMGEFMEGFERIGLALKEMYQMITLGGDAALDLKDSMDPFSEGIQFMVRPPKKSWKNIENLSGGEKTLSSLALVFALHHYRPTPLYVMDEIDAALDFRNVSIIGHYVKDRTKNAQFIIISLRNNMFELGDRLIGIYKTNDCTKNVVVDPKQIMEHAKKYKKTLDEMHSKVSVTSH